MKNHIYLLLTTLLLLLLQAQAATAQSKIQVVTKTIERKLDYYKDTELRVTGEKASIKITGWDKNYIGVKLKLIAKHPDRAIAEQDLQHMRYIIERDGEQQQVGNYFNVTKGTSPIRANLKAEYELMVPDNCPLLLSAKYGDASISNMNSRSEITLEYSKLTLQNVSGNMKLTSTLGDVTGTNISLTLDCEAQKADLDFTNASGTYTIQSAYGHVTFGPSEQLKKLQVQGNRTEVSLRIKNTDGFNYQLSTTHAPITLPAGMGAEPKSGSGGKTTYDRTTNKSNPVLKVSTTSSPINLGLSR